MKPRLWLNGLQIIFMKANADKFQRIIPPGGRENKDVQMSLEDVDIAYVQKVYVLGVYIDGKLNLNEHVRRISSNASAQISALQRLTGLIDYPSRKAIYTSFISSNVNYCPLVLFFTSRESINKIGVMTMSSPVVLWAVTVTACGATVSCWVVTVTAPFCSVFSIHTVQI